MTLEFAIVARRSRRVRGVWRAMLNAILGAARRQRGAIIRAWLQRGKQTGPERLERTWICCQIQGGPDFSPSATRVTGGLLIADMRHGALGGLAQHDHSGLFSLKK